MSMFVYFHNEHDALTFTWCKRCQCLYTFRLSMYTVTMGGPCDRVLEILYLMLVSVLATVAGSKTREFQL